MKSVIVYWSRYGNGKKIVDYLSKKFNEKKVETQIFKTDEIEPHELPSADFYIFSSPTEAFNVQKNMRKFIKNLNDMNEKKYGVINTHGMNKNWIYKFDKILLKKNMKKISGIDFRVGKDANTGNGLMSGWESKVDTFVDDLLLK